MTFVFSGLRVGLSVKAINRSSLQEQYTAEELVDEDIDTLIEDDLNKGSGMSADVGVLYTLPFISLVDLDVGLALQNLPRYGQRSEPQNHRWRKTEDLIR